jgi:hypothetical protein
MADYKIPNLCGASVKFNAIQNKLDTMISNAIDGLEVDASALKATMDTDVTSLVSDLKSMIPELPALPDVNLQGQLTSLSGLSAGSGQYKRLLADVTSKFGSGLTAGGFSLDTLVSDAATAITGGTDLCSAVPNFSVPAAGGDAVQKAVEVLQAEEDSLPEKLSTLLANVNFIAAKTAVEETFTSYEEIGEEVPTEDIGPYRVTEETTTVARASAPGANIKAITDAEIQASSKGSVTTQKISTPKNTVKVSTTTTKKTGDNPDAGKAEQERANVVDPEKSAGISSQVIWEREYFKENAVTKSGNTYKISLSNTPTEDVSMVGFDNNYRKTISAKVWGDKTGNYKEQNYVGKNQRIIELQWNKSSKYDSFVLDGKNITITGNLYEYSPKSSGVMFEVAYGYLDNYDPNYAGPIKQ